ncbi:transcriptional regulator, MerR family [Faunimonas pinastri]|uniref:Transcriptional regulator, MerR family n=1 Tax=Faunimonas pinastri TaxID=1855383 RepID=A0A1H9CBW4_9HYPH|nr:MerR family transcriptional regulator [Faunimonas pinastri]SEP98639.1 transcriptional regulator, MerR family [Faunimonas pinastri]
MKSPDAFRTISEVAEDLDLPQHVLRFWETRFPQIKPLKRGGGRRYYRPEDVDLLKGIRLLLYGEGFTIKGVQRLLKEKGVGFVAGAGQSGSVQTVNARQIEPAMSTHAGAAVFMDERASEGELSGYERQPLPARGEPPSDDMDAFYGDEEVAPLAASVATGGLSPASRHQLEAALTLLAEAKQLLDQSR